VEEQMDSRVRELRSLIARGARTGALRPLASALLADVAEGRYEFAAAPVRHPLGFLFAPLHAEGPWTLRLHIWSPEPEAAALPTSRYHSHAWELSSFVYCGGLTNVLVQPVPDGAEYRVFDIHGEGLTDTIVPTADLVTARVTARQTIGGGEVYRMSSHLYHDTEPARGAWTATFALATRLRRGWERVLGPVDLPQRRTVRRAAAPAALARAAAAVLTSGAGAG
jgi:hypothetical protein